MVLQYIQVVEDENEETIEIPSEEDGTLLLTTLSAQFPAACGLKYRNPDTGAFRGIRLLDGVLHPPEGIWGSYQYIPVFPKENKRKGEDGFDNPAAKTKRLEKNCSDLIVLGLPWKSTEDDLQKYFAQFGDLVLVQVKRDLKTGQSKGFGFIRFASHESQHKCCAQRHMIDGRWCDVTIPNSKQSSYGMSSSYRRRHHDYSSYPQDEDEDDYQQTPWQLASGSPLYGKEGGNQMVSRKVFIGRVTEDITAEDLRGYFNKFGEVVDVFIPNPYRAFAFVTFADGDIAQALCGEDHIIKGASVHVSSATPKSFDKGDRKGGFGGPGNFGQGGGWNSRGGSGPVGASGKGSGADSGMPANNIGMNLLNSAMLAAAQAMLQNPNGWGGMSQNSQGGSGGNMGGGDHQAPPSSHSLSNQGSFGGMGGAGSGGSGGGSGNWWGNENGPSSGGGGHYGGWGGSHGGRGGSGGGWS